MRPVVRAQRRQRKAVAAGILGVLALVVDAGARERGVGHALMTEAEVVARELLGALVRSTLERHGKVDVLVNNAATALTQPLGQLTAGAPLNLERAMKLNERLGGHLVAGHVDGIGTIRSRQQDGNAVLFTIEAPPEILRHCIVKGSVTVDGISLTIADLTDSGLEVSLIPETLERTTLGWHPAFQASDASNKDVIFTCPLPSYPMRAVFKIAGYWDSFALATSTSRGQRA